MTITSFEAHQYIEDKTISDIARDFNLHLERDRIIIEFLYIATKIMRGELNFISSYLDSFSNNQREQILNMIHPFTNGGTLLSVLLYWNSTDDAFNIYKKWRTSSLLFADDFNYYPWEQIGIFYFEDGSKGDPTKTYERNMDEFNSLYRNVKNYEGIA